MRQKPSGSDSCANSSRTDQLSDAFVLNLPEFAAVPASAGLTNAQAFELGVRHALTLLPLMTSAVFARSLASETGERFSL